MAPDADKIRQRKTAATTIVADTTGAAGGADEDEATQNRISTLKGLKGNEVAIDGVIYDITSFYHPGGEAIEIF
eukprot:CAMPEP_0202443846 /NCGR_PEP_ID=MMETSP1360-20130828/3017_1 /ASSEMBLY_ACC=CAM_ASM_000848 /TAXON_ID=515479 /ORGANISM="Licmophora paradoxa, Strain CCMP2313" /LENGTH=73 /DNA_ID=CAMNT_0049059653 /DNA_START=36 /DNA_END=254 /DNA_ORIENTATION=+